MDSSDTVPILDSTSELEPGLSDVPPPNPPIIHPVADPVADSFHTHKGIPAFLPQPSAAAETSSSSNSHLDLHIHQVFDTFEQARNTITRHSLYQGRASCKTASAPSATRVFVCALREEQGCKYRVYLKKDFSTRKIVLSSLNPTHTCIVTAIPARLGARRMAFIQEEITRVYPVDPKSKARNVQATVKKVTRLNHSSQACSRALRRIKQDAGILKKSPATTPVPVSIPEPIPASIPLSTPTSFSAFNQFPALIPLLPSDPNSVPSPNPIPSPSQLPSLNPLPVWNPLHTGLLPGTS